MTDFKHIVLCFIFYNYDRLFSKTEKGFYQVISKISKIYQVLSKTSKIALESYTVYMWKE